MIKLRTRKPYQVVVIRERPLVTIQMVRSHGPSSDLTLTYQSLFTYDEVLRHKCSILHRALKYMQEGIDEAFGGTSH